jgi:hypothetical protein
MEKNNVEPIYKYEQETTHDGLALVVRGEKFDEPIMSTQGGTEIKVRISIVEKESQSRWGIGVPLLIEDCSDEKVIECVDAVVKHIYKYDPKLVNKN